MTYDKLCKQLEQLSYRDKFRLAQLLIQLARKEEEEAHPERRQTTTPGKLNPDLIQYVADRLRKLKPSKKEALFNSIGAMFQYQGGISDRDKERIFRSCIRPVISTLGRTVAFNIRRSFPREDRIEEFMSKIKINRPQNLN